ncbi:precorrin-2 dehydrogenase/sirohydrochlorin ferrochelatase family protein [Geoglobus acetivorans]|uniref:precorrin-2 dehydrogenase/sirohydrochlorin ferrochelatase family protein n=1 Tax=Geoglobus acetivorans TaxID=565033 RepID=UPI00296E5125
MSLRIPLYIEFKGKNVLVIGGGGVGTSRVRKFLNAGANVRVLSLDFSDELRRIEGIELVMGDARDADVLEKNIMWCDLVTVAIPDIGINDTVIELARKHKALVNLANDADKTEVVVPFDGEVDGIRFAVTTEGKSGVVARAVRDKFLKLLQEDEEVLNLLKAMDFLKKYMKENNVPVNVRMKMYFAVSSDEHFRKLVRDGRVEEAKDFAVKFIEEYMEGRREIDESVVRIKF